MYNIEIKNKAHKELRSLPKKYIYKISNKIDALQINPRPSGCTKLKNSKNSYRIRVDVYRILYNIYDDILIEQVIKIANKSHVYK